jgi:hypothetical protein
MRNTSNVNDEVAQIPALARPAYDPPVFDSGTALVDVTDVADALRRLDEGGNRPY